VNVVLLKFPGQDFVYEMVELPSFPDSANTFPLFNHIGIDVLDIEKALPKALAAGAIIDTPIQTVETNGLKAKSVFILGPDGERIQFMQILSGEF